MASITAQNFKLKPSKILKCSYSPNQVELAYQNREEH